MMPTVALSTGLRTCHHHDPEQLNDFSRRYRVRLDQPESASALEHLRDLSRRGPLTLLTATKPREMSEATVLVDLLSIGPPPRTVTP